MMKRLLMFSGSVVCMTAAIACLTYAYGQVSQEKQNMTSTSSIVGLSSILSKLKSQTNLTVVFPALMPKPRRSSTFYAYLDPAAQSDNNMYTIDVDHTRSCHGAKYCNLGSFTVQKGGSVSMQTDMGNNQITQKVHLLHHQVAYYTPGHSMGDYWPPEIQWLSKGSLYTISWNVPTGRNAKVALMQMADSVITPPSNSTQS